MRGDSPVVAEWINHFAVAIPPEHRGYRHGGFAARSNGLVEERVCILDVR